MRDLENTANRLHLLGLVLVLSGCSFVYPASDHQGGDDASVDSAPADATPPDGAPADGGLPDGAPTDGGPPDSGDPCDLDGDGFRARGSCGGTDCNDENPNTYPNAPPDCTTAEVENCNQDLLEDLRMWLGYTEYEAGFVRPAVIDGIPPALVGRVPAFPHVALAAASGFVDGTGMVAWVNGTETDRRPSFATFDVADPGGTLMQGTIMSDTVMPTEVMGVDLQAVDEDTIAMSLIRDTADATIAYYGRIAFDAAIPIVTIDPITGVAGTTLPMAAGIIGGYRGPGATVPAFRVLRETIAGTNTIGRQPVASLDSGLHRFVSTDALGTGPASLSGGFGTYAFFSRQGDPGLIQYWNLNEDSGSNAVDSGGFANLTLDAPKTGVPSVAWLEGSDYAMAVPEAGRTRLYRVSCPTAGSCAPPVSAISVTHSQPTDTSISTLTEGAFLVEYETTGDGNPVLSFLRQDLTSVRTGIGMPPNIGWDAMGTPVAIESLVVSAPTAVTFLVTTLHRGGTTETVSIGGVRVCERL